MEQVAASCSRLHIVDLVNLAESRRMKSPVSRICRHAEISLLLGSNSFCPLGSRPFHNRGYLKSEQIQIHRVERKHV